MTAQQTDATTDPHSIIAALQQRLDAALSERDGALSKKTALAEELAARDAALAQRDNEFGDRIDHQAATLDVLRTMSASPGDAQPVFDLIVRHATELCNVPSATLFEYDGERVHIRSDHRSDTILASSALAAYTQLFPMRPTRGSISCRAILDRQIIHIRDLRLDPELAGFARELGHRSQVSVPLIRDDLAMGVITIGALAPGGFLDSQIELLKTFAEQAVIAIISAKTYRALQTRTVDLQESLEYQTATSDVLKVISRSAFDLQPVLATLLKTAARLCDAETAGMTSREGDTYRVVATFSNAPAFDTFIQDQSFTANRASGTGRTALDGHIIHIADLAADPEYAVTEAVTLGGVRTLLGVPLLREGEVAGVIILGRFRVQPFTDRQIELVRTFADQAVIAIENTRLINEQREALEQQIATAEVLQVINASPGKLAPVFDAILEKAARLCEAEMGTLWTYDGEYMQPAAMRGAPPSYAEFLKKGPHRPNWAQSRVLHGERFIHTVDVEGEGYRSGDQLTLAGAQLGGIRTLLVVPLRKDEAALGTIGMYRQQTRPFTDKQIALLENFAAQAVIAMENARLLNEQGEALAQQTATAEVLQVINASPGNLAPVFDAMLEEAMRLCGGTIGGIFTFDGGHSVTNAVRGVTAAFEQYNNKYPMNEIKPGTLPARIIEARGPVQNADVTAGEPYRTGHPYARALVELGGIRSVLAVPLLKDGVAVGMVAIYRHDVGAFSDKQIVLLENFAAQAVIAMENARLITEQREALEQQTATAEVLQVINSSPGNLAPVFDAILEKAHRLCGATHGSLTLFDGERFRAVATYGHSEVWAERLREGLPAVNNPGTEPLLDGARFVHIADMVDINHPLTRAAAEATGVRTALFVPLRKDNRLIGAISAHRREVRPFTEKEIALLENFGAQAVIAMENARLITEQREALEQQTATAEVLQVINASPGNLQPVFDAMLDKALRLCDANFGQLVTFDGIGFRAAAWQGFPPAPDRPVATPPTPGMALYRIIHGEEVVHVPDITADEVYRSGNPTRRRLADEFGGRTAIWVALKKDTSLLGAFVIYRTEVRPFSDKQIVLLQSFGAQAVIAMENARLLDEIRQRQEELRVTFENMGDGVAMFDETQHLVAWNRKFQDILDVPDDIIARRQTFSEYVRYLADRGEYGSGADADEHVRRLIDQAGQSRTYERTRPDGRVIEIRHNEVAGGGFVLIYADVTERKRSEGEIRAARDAAETALRALKTTQANLIQAEKMASLGQLTAGIAHEIKNPLNFVNNFAALSVDLLGELKETAAPGFAALSEKQRAEVEEVSVMLTSNLEKITEHGQRADGIVKAMLEHSRGSSAERRMVDLNALIDEALNLAYHGARAQDQTFNITLERDFGEGIAPIEVNPQDMTRVFLNIFSNGFYAATRRAHNGGNAGFVPMLKVTTRDAGEVVEIRVWDNGTGIPAEIRDKLFQPFFTTKPTGEGTGLGLSITYDIVTKQHGGTITVESEVDAFAEFVVTLPRQMFTNGSSRA